MSFREATRFYGATTTRTISGSSAQSAAISDCEEIRLYNGDTSVCYVAFGDDPTATTSDMPIGPGQELHCRWNTGKKVAVIGTAGTLYITKC